MSYEEHKQSSDPKKAYEEALIELNKEIENLKKLIQELYYPFKKKE